MNINRSVAGIVQRKNLFLVAKRKLGGALGLKWEFPGGKVEPGESPEQAMIREWDEELGVPVSVGRFLCRGTFVHGHIPFELSAYDVHLLSEDFTLKEHLEIQWLSLKSISKIDLADSDSAILVQLIEMEKQKVSMSYFKSF